MTIPYKPHYSLEDDVKPRLVARLFLFNDDVLEDGNWFFRWGGEQMRNALLTLNDEWYKSDPENNHFYKTEPYHTFPNTMMDYYKITNGPEGNSIYTHFYIHPNTGRLVISSFKEL